MLSHYLTLEKYITSESQTIPLEALVSKDWGSTWSGFSIEAFLHLMFKDWGMSATRAINIPCDIFVSVMHNCLPTRLGPWEGKLDSLLIISKLMPI